MKTKYVIFNDVFPVIFGDYFEHSAVVINRAYKKPTSAGFMRIISGGLKRYVEVYGESVSLNLKPSEDDAAILTRLINNE